MILIGWVSGIKNCGCVTKLEAIAMITFCSTIIRIMWCTYSFVIYNKDYQGYITLCFICITLHYVVKPKKKTKVTKAAPKASKEICPAEHCKRKGKKLAMVWAWQNGRQMSFPLGTAPCVSHNHCFHIMLIFGLHLAALFPLYIIYCNYLYYCTCMKMKLKQFKHLL